MAHSNTNTPAPETRTTTLIRAFLFVVVLIITAATIIGLKRMTNTGEITPEGIAARDSVRRFARPDTTESTDVTPESPATTTSSDTHEQPTDTLMTTDERTPADAGYEDGYFAGITDGVVGDERASYDETSQFPTKEDRQRYTDAYRRGYEQGFQDGLEGKEFSVVPQALPSREDDDIEPDAPAEEKPKEKTHSKTHERSK